MLHNKLHQGVVVPMVTPFTREGEVDLEAAEKIIHRFMACGVGPFVLGTTGETASIPYAQRLKLVERAVAVAGSRVPVYAGIGDNCLANSAEAAGRYLEIGVDAVVSHLPSYYPLVPSEMEAFFRLLHEAVKGPIMLYNIPQTTSMSLPMEVVERLSHLPHFVGFKDSERSHDRLLEAAGRMGGRDDFSLFMGSAVNSLEALRHGFNGLVPGSGNLVPELWADLYRAAERGDWEAGEILQKRLDDIATLFQAGRTLGQSLAALKVFMHELGLCEPHVLPPLLTPAADEHQSLIDSLESSNLFEWQKLP